VIKKVFVSVLTSLSLYANFTIIDGETFKLSEDENITLLDDLNISTDATLKSEDNSTININKDWINSGNFKGENISVYFKSEDNSTIYGNNIFYELYANKSIIFESSKTQKIINKLSLRDGKLSSTILDTQSILDLSLTNDIDTQNLEIQDSKIIGLVEAINPPNSIDNGNNILWFSEKKDCQNIGSNFNWIDKYSCYEDGTKYIVNKDTVSTEIIVGSTMGEDIQEKVIKILDGHDKGINIIYKDIDTIQEECSNDIQVSIYDDGSSITGYRSEKIKNCAYEDPTLQNWNDFQRGTKIGIYKTTKLEKQNHEDSNNVIVIDLNLTQKIVIGEKNDKN